MAGRFAAATHPRAVHLVADAAYRSKLWRALPVGWSFTTRLAANATLYAPAPPPTGKRGRPATKGAKLGKPADLAAAAVWTQSTICCYGKTSTVQMAVVRCLWYGSLGKVPVQAILVRDLGSTRIYDIALVTTDLAASAEQIVVRYAARWPVEQSIKDGKDLLGAGDAQNRLPAAVTRTVPFAMLCQSILILVVPPRRHRPSRPGHPPCPCALVPPQDACQPRRHADRVPPRPNNHRLRSSPACHTKPARHRDLHRSRSVSPKLQPPPDSRITATISP
jgi:hypothetical protein